MKKLSFMLIALMSMGSVQAFACTGEDITVADAIYQQQQNLFDSGLVTQTEVNAAKAHWLEMQLCKTPYKVEICEDLVATLQLVFEGRAVAHGSGTVSLNDYISAHSQLAKAKKQCAGIRAVR